MMINKVHCLNNIQTVFLNNKMNIKSNNLKFSYGHIIQAIRIRILVTQYKLILITQPNIKLKLIKQCYLNKILLCSLSQNLSNLRTLHNLLSNLAFTTNSMILRSITIRMKSAVKAQIHSSMIPLSSFQWAFSRTQFVKHVEKVILSFNKKI